ncbi:MAG: hypothetical protein JRN30_03195 [Nitrososphaerota archaeon]|nr:hypothetical protein [Nitrososphaerota archaeon]
MSSPRHVGVTVLALVEAAAGVYTAAIAAYDFNVVYSFISSYGLDPLRFPDFLSYFAILFAVGCAAVVIAYGLLAGKRWGWTLGSYLGVAYMVFAVGFGSYFVAQYSGDYSEFQAGIIYLLVSVAAVFYLDRPGVKARFGRGAHPDEPAPPPEI